MKIEESPSLNLRRKDADTFALTWINREGGCELDLDIEQLAALERGEAVSFYEAPGQVRHFTVTPPIIAMLRARNEEIDARLTEMEEEHPELRRDRDKEEE